MTYPPDPDDPDSPAATGVRPFLQHPPPAGAVLGGPAAGPAGRSAAR
jgi:hypothetical protein